MSPKYEITGIAHPTIPGVYRIRALRSFGLVKSGSLGGYVSSYNNLSHKGICWAHDDVVVDKQACVVNNAQAWGDAHITDNALVCDDSIVRDYVVVNGFAIVEGSSIVRDHVTLTGSSIVTYRAVLSGNVTVNNGLVMGSALVEETLN